MSAEVLKVLKAARAEIAKAWCQGDYAKEHAVCSIGAINLGFGMPVDYDDLTTADERRVFDLMAKAVGTTELARWNDEPGRTQAEVLAAFDKAIALAKEEVAP